MNLTFYEVSVFARVRDALLGGDQEVMTESVKFKVLADEHVAEEDTVSADELFHDLMAGFAELQAFEEGKTLRVTEVVDGERLPPIEMTAAELKTRQAARTGKAKSAPNGSAHGMTENILNEKAVAG